MYNFSQEHKIITVCGGKSYLFKIFHVSMLTTIQYDESELGERCSTYSGKNPNGHISLMLMHTYRIWTVIYYDR